MDKLKKFHGFTLIELILVIIIVSIIVAGSNNLLAQGFRAYVAAKDVINTNSQDIIALESITRDLRAIRSHNDITTATNTSITFYDTANNMVTYQLDGSTLQRNLQPLADNLPNFSFTYTDANGTPTKELANICYIKINLGPQKPETVVYPWNLCH